MHRKLPRNKSQTAVFVKALSCMSDIQKRKTHRVDMRRSGWQEEGRMTVEQVVSSYSLMERFHMYTAVVCSAMRNVNARDCVL